MKNKDILSALKHSWSKLFSDFSTDMEYNTFWRVKANKIITQRLTMNYILKLSEIVRLPLIFDFIKYDSNLFKKLSRQKKFY